jgi:hypothetical protein
MSKILISTVGSLHCFANFLKGIIYDLGQSVEAYSSPLVEGLADFFVSRDDVYVRTTNNRFSWYALYFSFLRVSGLLLILEKERR